MNNNFENMFKHKFEKFEQKPNSDLWKKIDKRLKRTRIFKTSAIIFSIAITFITGLVFLNSNFNQNENIIKPNESSFIISTFKVADNYTVNPSNNANTEVYNANLEEPQSSQNVIFAVTNSVFVDLSENENDSLDFKVDIEKSYDGFTLSDKEGCCPLTLIVQNKEPNFDNLTWKINGKEYKNSDILDITFDEPGNYEISLTRNDDGKTNTYKDEVVIFEQPLADFIAPNELFENKTFKFENLSQDANTYKWYVNNLNVSNQFEFEHSFDKAGTYKISLIATNELKCSDTISKTITVEKAEESIIFPTAFSPSIYGSNGGYYSTSNKQNKVFYPVAFKDIKEYKLSIYDKYGNPVFESDEPSIGWDGYYKNQLVDVGVYIYVVSCKFADGEILKKHGSVTVLYEK